MCSHKKITLILAAACNIAVIILEGIGFFYHNDGITLSVFYTNDSNILALFAAAIWLMALCCGKNPPPHPIMLLKYTATVCLCLTFLTVVCFLAPLSGYRFMLFHGAMLYQHLLCPILMSVSFLFFEEYSNIRKTDVLITTIPTVLYGAITIGMNLHGSLHGPYPFLLVREQPLRQSILWGVGILAVTIGIAMWIRIIKKKKENPLQ